MARVLSRGGGGGEKPSGGAGAAGGGGGQGVAVPVSPPAQPVPATSSDPRAHSTEAGPITGAVGAVPPAHAPRESAQPLQPNAGGRVIPSDAVLSEKAIAAGFTPGMSLDPAALARRNEQQLAPLKFDQSRPVVPDSGPVQMPPAVQAAQAVQPGEGLLPPAVLLPAAQSTPVQPVQAAAPAATSTADGAITAVTPPPADQLPTESPEPYQPARSNTDSPSRGIPSPITDPGKQITGGFGIGQPQYFPLDGQELRVQIEDLLDQLYKRIQNDLRFSIALCYPRVSARVTIEVRGFEQHDASTFDIPVVMHPHEGTALDVARSIADDVAFVLIAEKREVDDQGESVAPPDQIRQDLGLRIPRKQQVHTGVGGLQLADVVMLPGETGKL